VELATGTVGEESCQSFICVEQALTNKLLQSASSLLSHFIFCIYVHFDTILMTVSYVTVTPFEVL
jgi:hypothetical protein